MNLPVGILELQLATGVGARTQAGVFDTLRKGNGTPEDLSAGIPEDLLINAGLSSKQLEAIKKVRDEAARLADQLQAHDVRVLVKGFAPYPCTLADVLKESTPPILFAKGNLEVLQLPGVAFAGSRKSSSKGLTIAAQAAQGLARAGANIVSGYANGVDLAAHRAALEVGGATTFVLAEGILHFRTKADLADVFDMGRFLVLSEFPPNLRWLGRNAMQRNRTICGLSKAVIVVESGLDGGTFAAAETAQKLQQPLFVVEFADPPVSAEGNKVFLKRGAFPLRSNGAGGPSLGAVLKAVGLTADQAQSQFRAQAGS
jgi:DNA protecting protein DprA